MLTSPHSTLVRAHIKNAKSRSPKSYRPLLSSDLQDLISTGMLTLKAKLDSVMDETKFLPRLAEVWQFYFVTLPVSWVEGARVCRGSLAERPRPNSTFKAYSSLSPC